MDKENWDLSNVQEIEQEARVDDARRSLNLDRSLVGGERLRRQDVTMSMVRRPETRYAAVGRECAAVRWEEDLLRGGYLGAGSDGRCSCRRGM